MPDQFRESKHAKDCDCEDCLTAWGSHFESILLADSLAARDPEAHGAKPATGDEWRRFLDAEWPRVVEAPRG